MNPSRPTAASDRNPDRAAGSFASDNCSGAHPDLLAALARANDGHVPSYGADPVSARAAELVRAEFGSDARFWPVAGGTGANVTAIRAITRPHQAVICAETAHLNVDEAAAPEVIAGVKLLPVPTPDGKLAPELAATRLGDPADHPHLARPAAITITQATEVGTVYSPEEIRALADFAREHGLALHVDGARLANAAVTLGCGLAAAAGLGGDWPDGIPPVAAVSLGLNKNAGLLGDAVVLPGPGPDADFDALHKGSMQLVAKTRFASAQLAAQLEDGLWQRTAAAANRQAAALAAGIDAIDGADTAQPVEANIVFLRLGLEAACRLQAALPQPQPLLFPAGEAGLLRLVTSWDTTDADVAALLATLEQVLG